MKDYVQPDFYRFNEDSLKLVKKISEKMTQVHSILDMGAGCGIIGLELAKNLSPAVVDFLELQNEWEPFLTQNIKHFLPENVQSEVYWSSFSRWKANRKYELIVCNPPYYLPRQGHLSPDPVRAKCRSFIEDNWEILFTRCLEALAPEGEAWFVAPSENKSFIEKISDKAPILQFVWI